MAKTTQDYSDMNIYQKLLAVRNEFYNTGAKKTGKNTHAEFMYFELVDIVPIATPIFTKYGLLLIPTFIDGNAVADVVDVEKPEEHIIFTIPLQFIAEPAKFRMNEVQGVGAAVTYYRRYLYMIVLDLVEADNFDGLPGNTFNDEETPKTTKKNRKPATPQERQEIKEELTAPDEPATDLQVEALKKVLNTLLDKDTDQEEFVQEIALKTNGFTDITKNQCEQLINGISEMLTKYTEE